MSFFIHDALATPAAGIATQQGSTMGSTIMLFAFIGLFFLLFWLPQNKKMKEHRQLIHSLKKGDEVITNGGILGKINKITDDFIVLGISGDVEMTLQKSAISAVVPKGTVKTVN